MALGWVLTEGLAVDPDTGEVLDLTIRSFGILRARATPPSTSRSSTTPGRAAAGPATRCSPRWPRRRVEASDRRRGPRPEVFPARASRAAPRRPGLTVDAAEAG